MATNTKRNYYPFAAIVGQEDLKLCLILCAIDPSIGGVLIRGDKGTAKSTAARGLATLLPRIQVGYDPVTGALDPYNNTNNTSQANSSSEDIEEDEDEDTRRYTETRETPTPFVDLPIGATEDRVLGSIDFSATLKQGGKRVFAPGLLAAANRGILYIDEVNLLPSHLVDVLLDAAAMGVNTVQREGITMTHPAKFMLIGTMNQEEGDLRPQLLDRFGLMLDVKAPTDYTVRAEVVRQRIAFDKDPAQFRSQWNEAELQLNQQIQTAKELLSEGVVLSDDLLLLISKICTEFKVGSLRADITLYKTATALAAWNGNKTVVANDIKQVAQWVLAHRRRRQPFESPMDKSDTNDLLDQLMDNPPEQEEHEQQQGRQQGQQQQQQDQGQQQQQDQQQQDDQEPEECPPGNTSAPSYGQQPQKKDKNDDKNKNNNGNGDQMETFTASKPEQIKKLKLDQKQIKGQPGTGRRNKISNPNQAKGHYTRSMQTDKPVDLALDATLRAAVSNGLDPTTGAPIIHPENWRKKVRQSTTDTLILFVVDASGSMSARQRMEAVKGAVLALLTDAYQQRDRVGVIAFRGLKAEVLLEPTKSVESAERKLQRLPTGGRTPLAHALSLTAETIHRITRTEPDQAMLLIILSDGKANVPLPGTPPPGLNGTGDAWTQTEQCAAQLANTHAVPTLFLDTETGVVRVGRGKELSEILNADYLRLDDLSADGLVHTIRQAM